MVCFRRRALEAERVPEAARQQQARAAKVSARRESRRSDAERVADLKKAQAKAANNGLRRERRSVAAADAR